MQTLSGKPEPGGRRAAAARQQAGWVWLIVVIMVVGIVAMVMHSERQAEVALGRAREAAKHLPAEFGGSAGSDVGGEGRGR